MVSEQPDAIDIVHIPTGFVCLYDDETNSIDMSTWYEEAIQDIQDIQDASNGGTVMAA